MRPIVLAARVISSKVRPVGTEPLTSPIILIETARLNDVDPQIWLADVLDRNLDHKNNRIDEPLPRNCASTDDRQAVARSRCGSQAGCLPHVIVYSQYVLAFRPHLCA